ncbi:MULTISPECIES: cytochrome b5 domain-containing protein [Clostridium]|uniref:Cytochrome b5-like Heme/Steroid binding domain protein n=2 Tax=Clostridium TaxID=1485 RepID=D8GNP9_CLOLD|nr:MULTISPECIES: cytochrome b5 domain-containing protein [Clostridium]ADK15912.1 putative heme/steroid binding protein [Clostridium ljungdahlii DSM 13528]AGY75086.1 steroid-binding protein [Clostridium autoethanogenum DSM 10061]ALU35258.1 putative cytochrome b5-domain-containing protein [Clostridium autoethanogenum DSM 10061]OAA87210.1 Cytochrome b5-like Heme/Steroid binding domain protein [Clostridium ljungdahlii DSM 13528]OVY49663.1 Cytochrome b5-like Heme/Steroid binding domain protein [Clo
MDFYLMKRLKIIRRKITFYKRNSMFAVCPFIKSHYRHLMNIQIGELEKLMNTMNKDIVRQEKQFTLEELSKYNGAGGSPAYVAVNGIVYDVSLSPVWGGGTHFSLYAGKDLTLQFKACHSGETKILNGLPKVGELKI